MHGITAIGSSHQAITLCIHHFYAVDLLQPLRALRQAQLFTQMLTIVSDGLRIITYMQTEIIARIRWQANSAMTGGDTAAHIRWRWPIGFKNAKRAHEEDS